jgi:hypothetical protein
VRRSLGLGRRQQTLADAHSRRGGRDGDRAEMRGRGTAPTEDHGVAGRPVRHPGHQKADRRRSDGVLERAALQTVGLEHRLLQREQRIDIRRFGGPDHQIPARLGPVAAHSAVHG